ncbi:hypothetical protein N6H18_11025 [Reichenbachiella agarivorans]|uniref:Uncharacterized protein n=1 Tax=Reichenbachiella agarivorans TaxID=2979464 RepID=A0ABY6CMC6_9BACT|nr:hypothetical protein [Reichenbachiella agarivorans]UXP30884.1 hypothetical protein N6H18_11025 [Reichenbachiella agarivorans]
MRTLKIRNRLIMGVLAIYLVSGLSSCVANKPQSAWMDLPHARELDQKKGKRSKKAYHQHYAKNHR